MICIYIIYIYNIYLSICIHIHMYIYTSKQDGKSHLAMETP